MTNQKIKELLPHGSYQIIAESVGVAEGTVKLFFSKVTIRISAKKSEQIVACAKAIIEKNSLNGLSLIYGEEKIKTVKAALAA